MITSPVNPGIKRVIRLRDKAKEREKENAFVTEGVKLFCEAPSHLLMSVYYCRALLRDEDEKKVKARIDELKKDEGCRAVFEETDREVFLKMCDTKTPQGVICIVSIPSYDEDIIFDKENGLYLISEGIRDPGNMGTVIRTAESAGVTAVILIKGSADPYQPKCIRSTMGSIYRLPVIYMEDTDTLLSLLKKKGITSYASSPAAKNSFYEEDFRGKTAFWVGNEALGLSENALNGADRKILIPMEGSAESLNAAVSAGLLMYEALRQRKM